MLYELEAYSTANYLDVRYRAYTTSRKKAEAFEKIPKIQFTDSGHGIVFTALEVKKRREEVKTLFEYVNSSLKGLSCK